MNKYIGTFGSGHIGTCGIYLHVEIEAPDEILARRIMAKAFDGKWSGIYKEEFKYPEKYNTLKIGRLTYSHHNDEIGDLYWETHNN